MRDSLAVETKPGLHLALSEAIAGLMRSQPPDIDAVERALGACLDAAADVDGGDTRRLSRVASHLLFQLSDGTTMFQTCAMELDSWLMPTLTVERVVRTENGWHKIFARLAPRALRHDPAAFHQYTFGPAIIVYNNPITIHQIEHGGQALDASTMLGGDDLVEYYGNRQAIKNAIKRPSPVPDAAMQARKDADFRLIRKAFEAVVRGRSEVAAPDRASHPYRRAFLHILPRLIRPEDGRSVLACIADSLPRIRAMGFGGVLLGVVDKQSTNVYFGEGRDGRLTPYANNHGYWSSGETGIAPELGTGEDYAALLIRIRESGMDFIQDSVFGTLGYPCQVRRFAASALQHPTRCVMLGDAESDVSDAMLFLHDLCIDEENSLGETVDPDHYAQVILRSHLGSPFALPKPNLFKPEVRAAVLARSEWQIEQAGVESFRVDMAKHMGVEALRAILDCLKSAVATHLPHASGSSGLLLEYWTVKYRDIQFANTILAGQQERVYFYDFPLAHVLQQIYVCGHGFHNNVTGLLNERARWNIALPQLIPLFIDHDFNFRPIYNGSYDTRALVVSGYAMALMLSANSCSVYYGFQDAHAGVPDLARYFDYTELHARRISKDIFTGDDPASPAGPVATLLAMFEERGILREWDGGPILCSGDDDHVVVTRHCSSAHGGRQLTIQARFSRFYQKAELPPGSTLLYEYSHGPSVVISSTPDAHARADQAPDSSQQ